MERGDSGEQFEEEIINDGGTEEETLQPSEKSYEELITSFVQKDGKLNLVNVKEKEIKLDIERLVEKPFTHEFYCPNCNACIKGVILDRKRPEKKMCESCFGILILIGTYSKKWDILKCIVYGGLTESITSLSVVISAASADATTLNILALGLANLIGGLFVIGHNLRELKNDPSKKTKNDDSGEASDQKDEKVDRYEELLGRRGSFWLHATVVVLSFLVFGLVPLVTYGFSFLKSDNGYLKLAAVVPASLLCIALLAIGKAYIKRPTEFSSYIKTVVYYVTIALMVSGVSYIIGYLIKRVLEKLGWFESSVDVALPIPEKIAWGSY